MTPVAVSTISPQTVRSLFAELALKSFTLAAKQSILT